MPRRSPFCRAVPAAMVLCGLALLARAAPLFPQKPKTSDHKLSLADLDRVRIVLEPIPAVLRQLGVKGDEVEARCRRILRASGIEPDSREQEQVLNLKFYAMEDDSVQHAMGYIVSLRFNQPADLQRIGRTLNVPTYARIGGGLEPKDKLLAVLTRIVDSLIEEFAAEVRVASRQLEEESRRTRTTPKDAASQPGRR
jgi:hypothetical protein